MFEEPNKNITVQKKEIKKENENGTETVKETLIKI